MALGIWLLFCFDASQTNRIFEIFLIFIFDYSPFIIFKAIKSKINNKERCNWLLLQIKITLSGPGFVAIRWSQHTLPKSYRGNKHEKKDSHNGVNSCRSFSDRMLLSPGAA